MVANYGTVRDCVEKEVDTIFLKSKRLEIASRVSSEEGALNQTLDHSVVVVLEYH